MNKNKTVNPYSWDNISGDKYWKIVDILNDDGIDDITKHAELISIIEGLEIDTVMNMPIHISTQKIQQLTFLNSFDVKEVRNVHSLGLNGTSYTILDNISKMNVSQFIDYQNFVRLPFRDAYDKILSVFVIPKGCSYNEGYDITEVQRIIREDISWRLVQGLLSFLLRQYTKSFYRSLRSLQKEISKEKDPMKKEIMNSQMKDLRMQLTLLLHTIRSAGTAS